MAAHLTIQDIRQFPPEMQKQIMEELYPEPIPSPTHPAIPPAKPAEWYQVGFVAPERVPADPQQRAPAKAWYNAPKTKTPQRRTRKKNHMLLWVILAYALLLGACIIPGLIYQLK